MVILKILKRSINTRRTAQTHYWRKLYRPVIGGSTLTLGFTWCICQSETSNKHLDLRNVSDSGDVSRGNFFKWTKEYYTDKILQSSFCRFGRAAYTVSFLQWCAGLEVTEV